MPANSISLEKAKPEKLFYIVANVVVFRETDGRCLLLKRSDRETAHPGKFGVLGGKLEWKDLNISKPTRINGDVLDFEHALEDLLAREAHEEAGVSIGKPLHYINSTAYIRPDGVPTLLIKFAAPYTGGEVILEEASFSAFEWATPEEALKFPCIEGIVEEMQETIRLFTHV